MALMCSPPCMQLGSTDGISSSINRSRSAPAATLRAFASNYHANATAANPAATALHRQCSNVSTSSEYHCDDSPTVAAGAPSTASHSTCVLHLLSLHACHPHPVQVLGSRGCWESASGAACRKEAAAMVRGGRRRAAERAQLHGRAPTAAPAQPGQRRRGGGVARPAVPERPARPAGHQHPQPGRGRRGARPGPPGAPPPPAGAVAPGPHVTHSHLAPPGPFTGLGAEGVSAASHPAATPPQRHADAAPICLSGWRGSTAARV